MSTTSDLDRALRATLDGLADRTVVDGQLDVVFDRVEHLRQRPAWQATLRSISMSAQTLRVSGLAVSPAWRMFAIVSLLLVLILATLFAIGARPFGPPTNGRIVFGQFDPAQGDTVLYTVDPDGSHLLQLRPETNECPNWSPDGKRITITEAVMNGDGTGFHRLSVPTGGPLFVGCGVWSSDQKSIVAEGWNDTDASQVGLWSFRSSDGGGLHQLTTSTGGGHDSPIGFAPNGSTIAFMRQVSPTGATGLFLVDADGTNARRVGDLSIGGGDWAPDGRSILVTSAGRLYGVDVASGKATPVVIAASPGEDDLGDPQWSPDGTRILFNRDADIGGGQTRTDLFQMRADGTDVVRVTNDLNDDYFADWGTYPLVH